MKKIIASMIIGIASSILMAQPVTVPNQFQSGQPARAADVNANFEALQRAVNRGFGIFVTEPVEAVSADNTTVVTASCPANTLVMSANCSCDSAGNRNLGSLFSCAVGGNGGIVGCYLEAGSFNPALPPPRGRITVQCLGAIANDGNRIPTTRVNAGGADAQSKSVRPKSTEALAAELAAEEQKARAGEAEQRLRLGSR